MGIIHGTLHRQKIAHNSFFTAGEICFSLTTNEAAADAIVFTWKSFLSAI